MVTRGERFEIRGTGGDLCWTWGLVSIHFGEPENSSVCWCAAKSQANVKLLDVKIQRWEIDCWEIV